MLWDEQCQQETTRSQDYWKKSAGKEAVVLKMSHERKITYMAYIAMYDTTT